MHRKRVEPAGTQKYATLDEFLASNPQAGTHAIKAGKQWLDILFEDRGSDTTLVSFHGAATSKIKRLPYFSGKGIAESLGWNLIALSDPSLMMGDIDLAWFIGNRAIGQLRDRLSPAIRHILGSTKPVLFVGSGGAYSAIWFAQDFPDCSVVVFNPRLHLSAKPESAMPTYMSVCHKTSKPVSPRAIRRNFVVEDLGEYYKDGFPFNLYIIQNSGDKPFYRHQVKPFLERHQDDPKVHALIDYFGGGHKAVIPQDLLRECLRTARETAKPQVFTPGL